MIDKNAVDLKVDVQDGSLDDLVTATSSFVDYIVTSVENDPIAKITGIPREEIIDFIMVDVKKRLLEVENTKKEEKNNA